MNKILIIITYTLRDEYNELFENINNEDEVTLIYILNENYLNKISNLRKEFILQALKNFKEDLEKKNIYLNIVKELPDIEKYDEIRVEKQFCYDEIKFNQKIKTKNQINTQTILDDLDEKINLDLYTNFRKDVEKKNIYEVVLPKKEITKFKSIKINSIELYIKNLNLRFIPSRRNALKHLKEYIWEKELIKTYKQTRNQMLGNDFSTKFSPYLSLGILSVKEIIFEINKYEEKKIKNSSTYWVKFELLWREYCKWVSLKFGNKVFLKTGINDKKIYENYNEEFYKKFISGQTGYYLIDAGINELIQTGYVSNRVRQNMASFFVKNLHLPWILGAEFFEKYLLDYDPASNYLNWQYIAGCGTDSRDYRYFNLDKQTKTYDSNLEYINTYLKEKSPRIVDFEKSIEKGKLESQQITTYQQQIFCSKMIPNIYNKVNY